MELPLTNKTIGGEDITTDKELMFKANSRIKFDWVKKLAEFYEVTKDGLCLYRDFDYWQGDSNV